MATSSEFAEARGTARNSAAVVRLHRATLRHQEKHPKLSYKEALKAVERILAVGGSFSTPSGHSSSLVKYGISSSDFAEMTRDATTIMRVHKATIAYLADHPELGTGTGAYMKAQATLEREAGVE
jgi:hypothetical protein